MAIALNLVTHAISNGPYIYYITAPSVNKKKMPGYFLVMGCGGATDTCPRSQ
jgi:hypothetical protein